MGLPRLSKLELQIMDAFWTHGACSVREVQESFPGKNRPAFTTVQTMIYRLEAKKALRRTKRIGKANIFEAAVSRTGVQGNLIDELLNLFGTRPVVAHMVKYRPADAHGDVRNAEQELKRLERKEQSR